MKISILFSANKVLKANVLKANVLKANMLKANVLKANMLKANVLKANVLKAFNNFPSSFADLCFTTYFFYIKLQFFMNEKMQVDKS